MQLKSFNPLFLSLCVAVPSACLSSKPSHKEESIPIVEVIDETLPGEVEVQPNEIDEALESTQPSKVAEIIPEIGAEEDEINQVLKNGIPVELNEKVEKWIDFFTKKNSEAFQRFMDRGQPYKKMVLATLRDRGIPTELYYLAMIESGYVLHAKSPMSAVGFWQFIPATGRRYGLRVDSYVDERRDPRRATIAASMYLSDLNNVFDSWYLAMSAYNAGESRIMNAIMRGKSRDFWSLVKTKNLPAETMDYIPKFLAAFIIGSNPEKYGFRRPNADALEPLSAIAVPAPMPLTKIAEIAGVPLNSLLQANPHLNKGMTPPGAASYKIWVPQQYKDQFQPDIQDQLASHRLNISNKISSAAAPGPRKYHRVRRGETLGLIALKYGMSLDQLKALNHLKKKRIVAGMKLKIIPTEAMASTNRLLDENSNGENSSDDSTYKVRRGDNLHDIANRFGMSIHQLKKINNLNRKNLRIGQVLRVTRNS